MAKAIKIKFLFNPSYQSLARIFLNSIVKLEGIQGKDKFSEV